MTFVAEVVSYPPPEVNLYRPHAQCALCEVRLNCFDTGRAWGVPPHQNPKGEQCTGDVLKPLNLKAALLL